MIVSYKGGKGTTEPASVSFILPSIVLRPYLTGYWVARDPEGVFAGSTVTTFTGAGALLSVNFGRPNEVSGGQPIPHAAILGVQQQARHWLSRGDTFYIMTFLTPLGIARLFPNVGRDMVGSLLEVAALLGEGEASALMCRLPSWLNDSAIADELDLWFRERLASIRQPHNFTKLAAARLMLQRTGSVAAAAEVAGVTTRQFSRWHIANYGMGAKQLLDLHRIQSSLGSFQSGSGDALDGFSDQAHQIRSWKLRLGITPGAYRREGLSKFAHLSRNSGASTIFL